MDLCPLPSKALWCSKLKTWVPCTVLKRNVFLKKGETYITYIPVDVMQLQLMCDFSVKSLMWQGFSVY